ncbi:MAG: glycosyl hydrolase [Planctomycetota bacterium]
MRKRAAARRNHRRQRSWVTAGERLEPRTLLATLTLQAENGTLTGVSKSTAVAGYTGTGYVTGFDAAGDRVTWASFAATPGPYRISVRFRAPFGDKGFEGALNGVAFSGTFKQSSAFASYDAGLVTLQSSNTMYLGGGWNWYELDAVTFTSETPVLPKAVPAVPVNADATPLAKALLARVAQGYGTVTLAGQHGTQDLSVIQSASGKLPAIVEGDFMDYSPSRIAFGANPGSLTENTISLAKNQGYLVSMAWHWNAPTKLVNSTEYPWWRGFYTQGTTYDIAATLANPSGSDYQALIRDIDAIAVQLKKFAAADVPVLWRPLHESEGGWFWWGAKGPEAFKQLWRLTYDRLTNHHGIDNLVWVLTSEDPAWYPGDDVVDVIGVDGYPTDRSDTLSSRWSPLLTRFDGKKPIALTEFGGVPDIDAMRQIGVNWAYFASWSGSSGPSIETTAKVQRVYTSTGVVTKDENPALVPVATPGVVTVAAGVTQTDATVRTGTTPLRKRGPGTLVVTAASTFTGGTVVEEGELVVRNAAALGSGPLEVRAGARLTLDIGYDSISVTRLTLDPAARLDVGTGRIEVAAGGFDAATVRQRVLAALVDGGWGGAAGLGSTAALADSRRAIGTWSDASGITVGWAAAGDTNLDGIVDVLDVSNLVEAARYNAVRSATWQHGDFNYDGLFDVLDVAELVDAHLFGAGSYRTPPVAPAWSPHEVTFAVTNSWPENFSGSVTIRNRGPTPIDGWTLEFDMAATITAGNLWGAEIVSVTGTRYRLRNAPWTAPIAPGSSVTFTFNAGGPATAQMTDKQLDGLPVA